MKDTLGDADALVVIDAQVKFVSPGAPHETPGAFEMVPRIGRFADMVRAHGCPIIWVRRTARPRVGPGRHSESWFGPTGMDLYSDDLVALDPRIQPDAADIILDKPRQSCFYETDFESSLRRLGARRLVIAGFTTNVCVMATAMDAVARDLDVVVLSDLTAALPIEGLGGLMTASEVQQASLEFINYSFGAVEDSGHFAV